MFFLGPLAAPVAVPLVEATATKGGAPQVILAAVLSMGILTPGIVAVTLVLLFALRVAFWGAVAMGCTAAVGRLFGTVV